MLCIPPCKNPQYDFPGLLEDDDSDCFYRPCSWHIQNSRQFFLNAHTAMQAHLVKKISQPLLKPKIEVIGDEERR